MSSYFKLMTMETLKLKHTLHPDMIPLSFEKVDRAILELILIRQKEQDNPPNLFVFQDDCHADRNSGGFRWAMTPEGHTFWDEVLYYKNYYVFHNCYNVVWENPFQTEKDNIKKLKEKYKL